MTARVIIEADGGSRGNPGPAAFGALLRDADSAEIMAEIGEEIGIATNNVAEYRGLIAGLRLAQEFAPDALVEVRMDSKLVVEQMAGRWKVKHADMKRLAAEAQRLVPSGTTWTWVPRAENAAADALVNAALDGRLSTVDAAVSEAGSDATAAVATSEAPAIGWGPADTSAGTTLVLIRHGATDLTLRKLFSGSGGSDPSLNEVGIRQAELAADYARSHYDIDTIVTSPLARARETAQRVAAAIGADVLVDPRVREADFGDWEGYSFGEIAHKWPREMEAWLGSNAVSPPGGESFDEVYARSLETRDDLVTNHAGRTIAVVSHVGVIKMLVRAALSAPPEAMYRMELAPASFSTVQFWSDGNASLREFSVVPRRQ